MLAEHIKNLYHLQVRKAYRLAEVYLHSFSTSTMDRGEWSAILMGRSTPGEKAPGTHQKLNWVWTIVGKDPEEYISLHFLGSNFDSWEVEQ
jgi:hypothetical protein